MQGIHAALCYAYDWGWPCHPEHLTLVFLSVPDEKQLTLIKAKLELYDIETVPFHEPDLGNSLTAFAVGDEAEKRLSKLPLALRGGEDNGREHVVAASEGRCAGESAG